MFLIIHDLLLIILLLYSVFIINKNENVVVVYVERSIFH